MGDLAGPVPFFHDFFKGVNDALDGDFPLPGTLKFKREGANMLGGKTESSLPLPLPGKLKHIDADVELSACLNLPCPVPSNLAYLVKVGGMFCEQHGVYGRLEVENGAVRPALQLLCSKAAHALTLGHTQAVYRYVNSTFAVHQRVNFWEGGLPMHFSATACINPKLFAGVCLDYDAVRSGLRHCTVAVQHTCEKGCVKSVSVDGRCNVGLTIDAQCCPKTRVMADLLTGGADKKAVVGAQYGTNCGKKLMVRLDLINRIISLAAFVTVFDVKLGVSVSSQHPGTKPKLGLSVAV